MKYIVIANIKGDRYMTRVTASSACSAEHFILDMGICGRHEYGVNGAIAYDEETIKTDTFIADVMRADPISLRELAEIIEANNERIRVKDKAEARIAEIEKQMKTLTEELEQAKRLLAA